MLTPFSKTVTTVPAASPDLPEIVVAPAARFPLLSVVIVGGAVKQVTVLDVAALMHSPVSWATTYNASPCDNTRLLNV
jgi:hypothetical protein